jgi:hypothetical protein
MRWHGTLADTLLHRSVTDIINEFKMSDQYPPGGALINHAG